MNTRQRHQKITTELTWCLSLLLSLFTQPCVSWAHTNPTDVEIVGNYDNSLGSSHASSQGVINSQIIENRPLLRPGEMLEYVPGMVVTQHSGDGKANQYFLRGFNLDHGSDFATSINGMPINMPTNAHGHGYSDLNFLIPELVQRIDYRKGPYYAQDGDFSSAGSGDFHYKTRLDKDFTQITLGQRGYQRFVGAVSHELSNGINYVVGLERMNNNGPWSTPEGLRRTNGVFLLSDGSKANGWTASLMSYQARWTSTDQVPQSLINSGLNNGQPFGRFDSLDSSDGGKTDRSSLSLDWRQSHGNVSDKVMVYAINYDLNLFSNFTYFTNDPVNGDQFMQKEHRNVYGIKSSRQWVIDGNVEWINTLGVQSRSDLINVALANTQSRSVSSWIRQDNVRQNLTGVFSEALANWRPWLRTNFGLRYDQYSTHVDSVLQNQNSGAATSGLWSPKFSLILGPWDKTEYFFNAGKGFHSNDARGTTAKVDPNDSTKTVASVPGLVSSKGYEVGIKTEAVQGLQSSLSLWHLDFDAELVYVGDAGGTESGRSSRRTGIEWNNRWMPSPKLVLDADFALTKPRFSKDEGSGTRIPNAIEKVALLAATVKDIGKWNLTAQIRYIGPAALVENNSVRSNSSSIVNLKARRKLENSNEVYVDVFNLFNRKFNDISYFAAETLRTTRNGPLISDQMQVHPGEPRSIRVTYAVKY
jgi:outer membrane cobalamin receptor